MPLDVLLGPPNHRTGEVHTRVCRDPAAFLAQQSPFKSGEICSELESDKAQ